MDEKSSHVSKFFFVKELGDGSAYGHGENEEVYPMVHKGVSSEWRLDKGQDFLGLPFQ